jgi:miniconductance mechanosensitive channel
MSDPINGRRLTNLGTFRAYVAGYLRNHARIHQDMTFLVRHLQPTETGLHLQVYVFSRIQAWAEYESIQADIFDHLLAVLPEFGLRVFQRISDAGELYRPRN